MRNDEPQSTSSELDDIPILRSENRSYSTYRTYALGASQVRPDLRDFRFLPATQIGALAHQTHGG
jgi:hypothetical protein